MPPYRLYVFDLDGTLYRGNEPLPHAAETVTHLVNSGAMVRMMTNNSAAEPDNVTEKLRGMGIPCEPAWVMGTGPLAAHVCRSRGYQRIICLGEPALERTLSGAGLELVDRGAEAAVVGICRSMTYERLARVAEEIRQGAAFIATNRDATYPLAGGRFEPGAGAMISAVETAAGGIPEVLGKPAPTMLEMAMADADVTPEETLVIGDREDTDMACADAAGCHKWLVLTGAARVIPEGTNGSADLSGLPR